MDQKKRTVAKALTWQASGFVTMTGLGYLTTGSWSAASGLAAATFCLGTVFFIIHERIWARIGWGILPRGAEDTRGG